MSIKTKAERHHMYTQYTYRMNIPYSHCTYISILLYYYRYVYTIILYIHHVRVGHPPPTTRRLLLTSDRKKYCERAFGDGFSHCPFYMRCRSGPESKYFFNLFSYQSPVQHNNINYNCYCCPRDVRDDGFRQRV